MKLFHYTEGLQFSEPSCVTVGNFDGVHLGHHRLIKSLSAKSRSLGLKSILCTFEPLPEHFFAQPLQRLVGLRTKFHLLSTYSIDNILLIAFKHKFSQLSPQDFIRCFLVKQLNAVHVITGQDFCFGRNRQGTVEDLIAARNQGYFDYQMIADYVHDGVKVSSTLIRSLLTEQNFIQVASYLGRPYCLYGRVVKGRGIGKSQLGTATANMNLANFIPPIKGVFACRASIDEGPAYPARSEFRNTSYDWRCTIQRGRRIYSILTTTYYKKFSNSTSSHNYARKRNFLP